MAFSETHVKTKESEHYKIVQRQQESSFYILSLQKALNERVITLSVVETATVRISKKRHEMIFSEFFHKQ